MDIQNTDLCPCVLLTEMPVACFLGENTCIKRFRNVFSALYPIIGGFFCTLGQGIKENSHIIWLLEMQYKCLKYNPRGCVRSVVPGMFFWRIRLSK